MREASVRRLLSALLALYPASFRDRMGADLVETAVHRWREGSGRFWWLELPRFAIDGLLERLRTAPSLIDEFRLAWRQVRRRPGHHALAVITLALGVGATTTIFTVADAVVIRPLPYPDSHALYLLSSRFGGIELAANSLPNLRDMQASVRSFTWLAGVSDRARSRAAPALTDGGGDPERVVAMEVTAEYLPRMGARVRAGRAFNESDHAAGAPRVAIVSAALWQRRWGSDESVLDRPIRLDGVDYTVVGVMLGSFRDPEPLEAGAATDVWIPVRENAYGAQQRDNYAFRWIGRLAPGVSLDAARSELTRVGGRLAADHPDINRVEEADLDFVVQPLRDLTLGDARSRIVLLLGAVVLLLLLSCANVANLFLARGITRTAELSVRSALGATRTRLAAQLFAESVLTAALAGLLGGLLAVVGVRAFMANAPAGIPRLYEVTLDGRVLLFLIALTLVTAVVFGTAPALRGARAVSAEGTRTTASRAAQRLQSAIVSLEVALSMVLVAGSALLLNSLAHLLRVGPGFDAGDVLVVDVRPPTSARSHAEDLAFYRALIERMRSAAGVADAALIHSVPGHSAGLWSPVTVDDGASTLSRGSERARAPALGADPGGEFVRINPAYGAFLQVLDVPLLAGSPLRGDEGSGDALVVMLNQSAARRFYPGVDPPIGRRIALGSPGSSPPWREVVGIVGDVRQRGPGLEAEPQIYIPYGQRDADRLSLMLELRSGAVLAEGTIRQLVREVAEDVPVDRVEPLRVRYAAMSAATRFLALLLTVFAAVGLLLAMVGTYATASHALSRRLREMGIRVALGARAVDLFRHVLARSLVVCAAGIAAGILLTLAFGRFVEGHIYGIRPRDPLTVGVAALLIVLSAVLACVGPALRAARVDPNDVLRVE